MTHVYIFLTSDLLWQIVTVLSDYQARKDCDVVTALLRILERRYWAYKVADFDTEGCDSHPVSSQQSSFICSYLSWSKSFFFLLS